MDNPRFGIGWRETRSGILSCAINFRVKESTDKGGWKVPFRISGTAGPSPRRPTRGSSGSDTKGDPYAWVKRRVPSVKQAASTSALSWHRRLEPSGHGASKMLRDRRGELVNSRMRRAVVRCLAMRRSMVAWVCSDVRYFCARARVSHRWKAWA